VKKVSEDQAMPQDQQMGFVVELDVQAENGSAYVSSKQVAGLHLVGKCLESMKPIVEQAMKRLFKDNQNQDINVIWLSSAASFPIVGALLHSVAIYPAKKAA
jgi:hypothetical protein